MMVFPVKFSVFRRTEATGKVGFMDSHQAGKLLLDSSRTISDSFIYLDLAKSWDWGQNLKFNLEFVENYY